MRVSRPSGKITSVAPPFTVWISWRVASGRVGSSGSAFMWRTIGLIHHLLAQPVSIAKIGSWSSIEKATGASSRLTWLSAMMAVGPAASRFSWPWTASR